MICMGGDRRIPEIVSLNINELQPICSKEGVIFFVETIRPNHTGQGHFTNPGADLRYRRPLGSKIINRRNPPQSFRTPSHLIAVAATTNSIFSLV